MQEGFIALRLLVFAGLFFLAMIHSGRTRWAVQGDSVRDFARKNALRSPPA